MFYGILGGFLFFVSLIVAIVLFAVYKKVYPVFYLISVALYIFTAGFAIDVFNIERFGILAILLFSAILFMFIGYYLSQVFHLQKSSKR